MIKLSLAEFIILCIGAYLVYINFDKIKTNLGSVEVKQTSTEITKLNIEHPEPEETYKKDSPQRETAQVKQTSTVAESTISQEKALKYIAMWYGTSKDEMQKFGIPASISLAQGLLESNAGTSKLVQMTNNHFGMKCFSKNCKTGHCTNHTDDSHKDFFLKFDNPWDSWRKHSEMITSGNYKSLTKLSSDDYKGWANGLKRLGYATNPTYANKIIELIERFELYKYDSNTKIPVKPVQIQNQIRTKPIKVNPKKPASNKSFFKGGPISSPPL